MAKKIRSKNGTLTPFSSIALILAYNAGKKSFSESHRCKLYLLCNRQEDI